MRTWERLEKIQTFLDAELCQGREMKCPKPATGQNGKYGPNITDFTYTKPRVFIGWQPMRPDDPGGIYETDPYSAAPGITIMPTLSYVRYVEEKRFDRFNKFHRTQDMGQRPRFQMLFCVYEPGVRLPGFADSLDAQTQAMNLFKDGTEAGMETLVNWMDDANELLLRHRTIPETDLILQDDNFTYGLFTDQEYIVDRRPYYYGFLNVEFAGFASKGNEHGKKTWADELLDG